jgi:5-methylphenazine-1-carboxylate 1-monooxygenase
MKVLITGGGIGGLSLGLSLHAAGIDDVEVFEAAPSIDELGVGINVLPHAMRELTELGLADDLSSAGLATGEFVMFNKHGQRIWGEPRGLAAGYRWPQCSIHRGRLLGVLYRAFVDRLGEHRLHTDHRVVHAAQDDTSVSVHLASGAHVGGDVVVGADGIHSAIRAQLVPGEGAPLWNGITMWRALTEAAPCLTGSSMVIIGHFGKRTVVYPITAPADDGRSLINVVLEAKTGGGRPMPRQDWTHAVDRDEIRALFATMRFDWLDVAELIETAQQWWQYPMVDRDPLPAWRSGRITLLGDAAHPMYPVGANGASQAILDARTLARTLALAPTIEAALDEYESTRRPATAAIVAANRDVGAEKCMELAEQRAPNGFDRIEDVFAPGELEALSTRYKHTAGFAPDILNERPSLSVRPPPRAGT